MSEKSRSCRGISWNAPTDGVVAGGAVQSKKVRITGAILGEEFEGFAEPAEGETVVRLAGPRAAPKFCANSELDANCAACVKVKNSRMKTILNDNEQPPLSLLVFSPSFSGPYCRASAVAFRFG